MTHLTPNRGMILALLLGASLTLAACNRQQENQPTTSGTSGAGGTSAPSQPASAPR